MLMDSMKKISTEGRPNGAGKPHVEWVATAANATLIITINGDEHDGLQSMSVVAESQHDDKWEESRLRVRVWDEGQTGQGPRSQILDIEIEGVHDLEISTLFNHKFPLDIAGVPKGTLLKAPFDLIGGTTFKINGILFCSW